MSNEMMNYGGRRWLAIALALGGVLALGHLAAELYLLEEPGFPLDDSWIHLQFARNLASGEGMSYQEGRAVAGSTAPLWTALLALGAWNSSFAVWWAKVLGLTFHLLSVVALASACRHWRLSVWVSGLALMLYVFTDWLLWSALSGMEIPLFLFLSTWGVSLHLQELSEDGAQEGGFVPWSTVWLALACLARPEGLLLLALSWLDRSFVLKGDREIVQLALRSPLGILSRNLGRRLLFAAAILGPVALYFLLIGGSVLPTTYEVKTEAGTRLLPSLRHLWDMLRVVFQPQPFMVLLLGAGTLVALRRSHRGLLPVLWLFGLPVAYSVMAGAGRPNLGNFGRYLFPLFPMLILVGCLGLDAATRNFPKRLRVGPVDLRNRLLLAGLVLLPTVLGVLPGLQRYLTNVSNVQDTDVAVARWLAKELPVDARIAVQDIGAIAYFAPQPLIDMVGIVNPEILPYIRGDKMGSHPTRLGGWAEFLRASEVDYLVMFPNSYGGLQAIEQVLPGLVPIHSASIERNLTMAGSELVVFAVPDPSAPTQRGTR